jgi:hypothetical protein
MRQLFGHLWLYEPEVIPMSSSPSIIALVWTKDKRIGIDDIYSIIIIASEKDIPSKYRKIE